MLSRKLDWFGFFDKPNITVVGVERNRYIAYSITNHLINKHLDAKVGLVPI